MTLLPSSINPVCASETLFPCFASPPTLYTPAAARWHGSFRVSHVYLHGKAHALELIMEVCRCFVQGPTMPLFTPRTTRSIVSTEA